MQLDNANSIIKDSSAAFETLKSVFTKIFKAENDIKPKRIGIFETLYNIETQENNKGLKNIYKSFREEMKNLEEKRQTNIYKIDQLKKVTEMYSFDFKEQKRKLEDLAKNRKLLGITVPSTGQNRPQFEKNAEKDFRKFIETETDDQKNLILHFIYSELKYHSESLEKLSKLFFEINDIEPLAYIKEFGKNYVGKYDYKKLKINLEDIENKEKSKKKKKNKEKDEIYNEDIEGEKEDEDEDEDKKSKSNVSNSFVKEDKEKFSSGLKNSTSVKKSIKKSVKKSKVNEIKPNDNETEIEKPKIEDDE